MTLLVILAGLFAVGMITVGVMNRRSSPAPVRARSDRDGGGTSSFWADPGGSSSGGADCAPSDADCSSGDSGGGDGGGGGGD